VLLLRAQSSSDDLTGTRIFASGPIGVFGGNVSTQVPTGRRYRDHLEQQIFPRQALGDRYIVGRSRRRPVIGADETPCIEDRDCGESEGTGAGTGAGTGEGARRFVCCEQLGNVCTPLPQCFICETDDDCRNDDICCEERGNTCLPPTRCSEAYAVPDYIRILADLPDTTVSFHPPISEDVVLTAPGDWVEITLHDHVEITSTEPVLIGHFFAGSMGFEANNEGDPTFILQVPIEQYRTDYVFICPETYNSDYVSITATPTSEILLDGSPVTLDSGVVGTSGMSVTIVEIEDGHHAIEGDAPFGITVYGFGGPLSPGSRVANVSYGYPGGLNLLEINPKD
jgi:hypothetical protein